MSKKSLALLILVLATLAAAVWVAPATHAFPKPADYSHVWQFDFTHAKPQPISFRGADGQIRWYWFMTYKVVNNTGAERLFIPEFTIATDAGDILAAGKDVPPGVFDVVKDQAGVKLLENPAKVVGRLLQGEDHARESVAIWPAQDHDVDQVTVFISGLSGETQVTPNPLTQEPVTMRKTLQVKYLFPGTDGRVQDQVVLPQGETWVMR